MLKDFLTFDKMIAPILIKIFFWVGVGMSVLSGVFWMLSGLAVLLTMHSLFGLVTAFGGVLVMTAGILGTRLICELYIVVFLIHDDLVVIRKSTTGSQPNVPAYAPAYAPSYAQPTLQQPSL